MLNRRDVAEGNAPPMSLRTKDAAAWFDFEEDKMYSKRESELIQQYLQEHGEMPGGGDSDLDDLF